MSCDKLVGLLDPCLTFVYNTTGKIIQVLASFGISIFVQLGFSVSKVTNKKSSGILIY